MALVNQQQIIDDDWSIIKTTELPEDVLMPTISLQTLLTNAQKINLVLPICDVLNNNSLVAEALNLVNEKTTKQGVWVNVNYDYKTPDDANIAQLDALLKADITVDLVLLYVPAFAYGRAFSLAQHLRLEGYKGEIRLAGDFGLDQLAYYNRSGVNTYLVADEKIGSDFFNAFDDLKTAADGQSVADLPMFKA